MDGTLVSGCEFLNRLTNFSVDFTYECSLCETVSTIVDNMNIRYENIHAGSIYEILTEDEYNILPILKRCNRCQRDTSHFLIESSYDLPDVLIISLQRFEQNGEIITKDCREVLPSPVLQFEDEAYSLNAVLTHIGKDVYEGHYITSLFKDGRWIHCNDLKVSRLRNDVPIMGYLFFYDKIGQMPLTDQNVSSYMPEKLDASSRQSSSKNSSSTSQEN